MKQELKDIATQAIYSSPTTSVAWFTKVTVAEWVAIILGFAQLLYLLRKWWREETEWGLRLKRWAGRVPRDTTSPGDLA